MLDAATRAVLEPRFGHDLSRVRIHSDAPEVASAGARAITAGHDVAFSPGQYMPHTDAGMKLLAHELAHVVQQGGATVLPTARQPPIQARPNAPPMLMQELPDAPQLLNYERLADELHSAMAGLGTDEEAVYRALQRLRRNPSALQQLERVYLQRYGESLEAAIRDDFSGEELEYALQLMNRGTQGSAQRIESTPSAPVQLEAAARRLRNAVERLGTDEEAIYAVLLPFRRDAVLIRQLATTYQNLYQESLFERLSDELSGSEWAYASYLLGGAPMRARREVEVVPPAEAELLFQELARLTFPADTGVPTPVPFHYPVDGCYARAQIMAERLTELGYASRKVFAVSTTPAGLQVRTDYAADMPPGQQQTPTVRWWYHVAPIIQVSNPNGTIVEMVLDPSLTPRPVPLADWVGRMSQELFTRMSVGDIQNLLAANRNRFPGGTRATYTTDRDAFWPTGPFEQSPAEAHAAVDRPRLTEYARRAAIHEVAAVIREQLRRPSIDVAAIVAAILRAPAQARSQLWQSGLGFPNLRAELGSRLSAADLAQIDSAVSQP